MWLCVLTAAIHILIEMKQWIMATNHHLTATIVHMDCKYALSLVIQTWSIRPFEAHRIFQFHLYSGPIAVSVCSWKWAVASQGRRCCLHRDASHSMLLPPSSTATRSNYPQSTHWGTSPYNPLRWQTLQTRARRLQHTPWPSPNRRD